jgi:hypothetical protein
VHSRTLEGCGTSLGADQLQAYGTRVTEGISQIGVMKKWHKELETIGLKASYLDKLKNDGAEHFIQMWESSEYLGTH